MLKKFLASLIAAAMLVLCFTGCAPGKKNAKIGVSFGVGAATRWDSEAEFMKSQAAELGAEIDVRINRTEEVKSQKQDCFEMIDSGIDVLILTPRDVTKVSEILDYAKSKNVPVISYSRVVLGQKVDLFVGYDSERIGQKMGQFLSELVYKGNYIILQGPPEDNNATLLYNGMMQQINTIKDNINIILDASVPGWSPEEAGKLVKEAITKADGKIDAILAPNDKIAEACANVIKELGVENHVAITGMDAEITAIKRIVEGTQDMTMYMDLESLARTAVTEANNMATGKKVNVNAEFDNQSDAPIAANLIAGEIIVKSNIDRILIESGVFTKEEIYG